MSPTANNSRPDGNETPACPSVRRIHLLYLNGHTASLTARSVLPTATNAKLLTWVILVSLLLSAAAPDAPRDTEELVFHTVTYAAGGVLTLWLYFALIYALLRSGLGPPQMRIYSFVPTFVASLIASLCLASTGVLTSSGETMIGEFLLYFSLHLSLFEVNSALYATYVSCMALRRAQIAADANASLPPTAVPSAAAGSAIDAVPLLRIGTRSFRSDEITMLAASGRHATLLTASGPVALSMSFASALASLPPDSGIIARRGVWVAHHGIDTLLTDDKGKPLLRLKNGTTVPVARARKTSVAELV